MIPSLALVLLGQQTMKPAPEFIGGQWLNTAAPITIASRSGKITLVHFWTFACINCKHNLPAVQRLSDTFQKRGVQVVSIHTPELPSERDFSNVQKAVKQYGIKYPVLFDPENKNWRAWNNEYWPTLYVVDKHGRVRGSWVGEMNFNGHNGEGEVSQLVTKLLAEK